MSDDFVSRMRASIQSWEEANRPPTTLPKPEPEPDPRINEQWHRGIRLRGEVAKPLFDDVAKNVRRAGWVREDQYQIEYSEQVPASPEVRVLRVRFHPSAERLTASFELGVRSNKDGTASNKTVDSVEVTDDAQFRAWLEGLLVEHGPHLVRPGKPR